MGQDEVLAALEQRFVLSYTELEEITKIPYNTLKTNIKGLVKNRLVERIPSGSKTLVMLK